MSPTGSRTVGIPASFRNRSDTNMPAPPRSTPACPRTSAPAPCDGTWTPPSPPPCSRRAGAKHEAQGRLHLAAARGDGRAPGLHCHRTSPLLRERGIDLSASQVHRLVSGTPERMSLQVMAALCDILSSTPADLVSTTGENAGVRKTATGDPPAPQAPVAKLRPRPARILPEP